jgi:hypothetical protein
MSNDSLSAPRWEYCYIALIDDGPVSRNRYHVRSSLEPQLITSFRVDELSKAWEAVIQLLNTLGKAGWELVTVASNDKFMGDPSRTLEEHGVDHRLLLKRPIET